MQRRQIYNELIENVEENRVLKNEEMSKHTTFKIGGPADIFIKIKSLEELQHVLEIVKKNNCNLTIIGNGSNILVKDKGIRGIVLKLEMDEIIVNGTTITADAGALLYKICKKAQEQELEGLEFAYGIPGTIGGAVYMNAGAYGKEMKEVIISTTYIDKENNIKTITNEEHEFSYRKSIFSETSGIILRTTLSLKHGNKEEIKKKMEQNREDRKEKQPINFPNAGSIFKRGKNYITSKLIDEAGLKGFSIGGATVSTLHSGFIINSKNATAEDVLNLVEHIKKIIKQKFNQEIELEIKVLGE